MRKATRDVRLGQNRTHQAPDYIRVVTTNIDTTLTTSMILITGFGPFGGDAENPSRQSASLAVQLLNSAGITASFLEVPVVFASAGKVVLAEVDRLKQHDTVDAVVCVGVASNRPTMNLETTAVNCQQARIPDNEGNQPRGTPVVPPKPQAGGVPSPTPKSNGVPAVATTTNAPEPSSTTPSDTQVEKLYTRLPVSTALPILRRAGVPTDVSDDAGLYVCNSLFYETLHALPEDIKVGFVHVPLASAVSIEDQARGLVLLVKETLGLSE